MKDFDSIQKGLTRTGWEESSAQCGALDWEDIVGEIPIGAKVRNVDSERTGVTLNGGFYDDYLSNFKVKPDDKEYVEEWPVNRVELVYPRDTVE